MKIERVKLLALLSEALDSVESEMLGTTDHHAKRVAWLGVQMATKAGMSDEERLCVGVSALLHDSALNEYREGYGGNETQVSAAFQGHCIAGEENLRLIPGCEMADNFVLYHHECADGSGPFGKVENETPLGAQMVHIADETDRRWHLGQLTPSELPRLREYIENRTGSLFGKQISGLFLSVLSEQTLMELSDDHIAEVSLELMDTPCEMDLRVLAGLFARIIDYKSPFTKNHSLGLAEKAEHMANYYGWGEETAQQLYCAGALHDIGKLMVDKDILEKPGKLDATEYQHIQSHAYETYRLLSKLESLDTITPWASYHHEKLNGKGYPFGKTAEDLDKKSRLLACLDIYQALTENRPYKAGMPHGKAMAILGELVQKGELDAQITEDIGNVFWNETAEQDMSMMALFQCPVCGHIYEGDILPHEYVCPVCAQPETAFIRIR